MFTVYISYLPHWDFMTDFDEIYVWKIYGKEHFNMHRKYMQKSGQPGVLDVLPQGKYRESCLYTHRESIERSGVTDLLILIFGTRWRLVLGVTPWQLFFHGNNKI
jgi:hypothetical protein